MMNINASLCSLLPNNHFPRNFLCSLLPSPRQEKNPAYDTDDDDDDADRYYHHHHHHYCVKTVLTSMELRVVNNAEKVSQYFFFLFSWAKFKIS